jgi:hypothetical protein
MPAKLVPTFADRGCRVVSATDPHGRILGFLDRSRYYFFQAGPQLYSRGWVNPVPDPLLIRKSGSAGNRTRNLWISSQELWPLDHRGGQTLKRTKLKMKSCQCEIRAIPVLSAHLSGGTKTTHKKTQDNWSPGRNLSPGSVEYESRNVESLVISMFSVLGVLDVK